MRNPTLRRCGFGVDIITSKGHLYRTGVSIPPGKSAAREDSLRNPTGANPNFLEARRGPKIYRRSRARACSGRSVSTSPFPEIHRIQIFPADRLIGIGVESAEVTRGHRCTAGRGSFRVSVRLNFPDPQAPRDDHVEHNHGAALSLAARPRGRKGFVAGTATNASHQRSARSLAHRNFVEHS